MEATRTASEEFVQTGLALVRHSDGDSDRAVVLRCVAQDRLQKQLKYVLQTN